MNTKKIYLFLSSSRSPRRYYCIHVFFDFKARQVTFQRLENAPCLLHFRGTWSKLDSRRRERKGTRFSRAERRLARWPVGPPQLLCPRPLSNWHAVQQREERRGRDRRGTIKVVGEPVEGTLGGRYGHPIDRRGDSIRNASNRFQYNSVPATLATLLTSLATLGRENNVSKKTGGIRKIHPSYRSSWKLKLFKNNRDV